METENKTSTEIITKKGYGFLRELCAFSANFHAFRPQVNPITNRVQYLIHQLDTYKVPYTVDKFQPVEGTPDAVDDKVAFVNVYVNIEGVDTTNTTVFLAHHDVANIASENCQDNTASVCNLLDLAIRLTKEKPATNVVIAFVDAEEIVAPKICGSKRLAEKIKAGAFGQIRYIFNLELTAHGRNYWLNCRFMPNEPLNISAIRVQTINPAVSVVSCPYNDSYVLEMEGLPSICMGSLDDKNIAQVRVRNSCATWFVCHNMRDTFEAQAVESDMDAFVDFLQSLI